jgi:hypothetical protein
MSTSKKQTPLCNQCGRKLILVGKTETKDTFSKIIIKTYRCPDEDCQRAIDKRTKARIKLQKEQEEARKVRAKTKSKTMSKSKSKMRLNKRKILR